MSPVGCCACGVVCSWSIGPFGHLVSRGQRGEDGDGVGPTAGGTCRLPSPSIRRSISCGTLDHKRSSSRRRSVSALRRSSAEQEEHGVGSPRSQLVPQKLPLLGALLGGTTIRAVRYWTS